MAAQQSGVLIVSPSRSQLRRHEMGQPLGQSVKCSGCDLLADLAMQAVRRLLTLLAHFQFVKQRPLTFPPWEAPSRCDVTSSGGTVMVQIKVTRMNCGGCAQVCYQGDPGRGPERRCRYRLETGCRCHRDDLGVDWSPFRRRHPRRRLRGGAVNPRGLNAFVRETLSLLDHSRLRSSISRPAETV